jgi:7,8-dihydropterin-6-yl-methyl-4-(beta-D-ribofuranosyl)aminobenzene 5'-phosphate synthase
MQFKVIAVGSTKWERLIRRWGVSFLVGEDLLFDTFGDEKVFLRNIQRFHIDLDRIRHIVLSHDDWDHISGFWGIIERCRGASVYLVRDFNPEIKKRIADYGIKIIQVDGPMRIKEGIYSTGQLPGNSAGRVVPEQALAIQSRMGLSVITGCAHPGIIEIIRQARGICPGSVYLVAGGFHLKDTPINQVREVIDGLKQLQPKRVCSGHCTGCRAERLLRKDFSRDYFSLKPGLVLEL